MVNILSALEAFEEYSGIPNPVEEKELPYWQYIARFGDPIGNYPREKRHELEAFIRGFDGKRMRVPPLDVLVRSLFDPEMKRRMKKTLDANRAGYEANASLQKYP